VKIGEECVLELRNGGESGCRWDAGGVGGGVRGI
jgi:hypothetical protein